METLEHLLATDIETHPGTYRDAVLARIREELPGLFAQPDLESLARAGTEALLRQFATVLRLGQPREFHAPPESLVFGQRLARAGLPLAQLLRSYRLGHEVIFQRAADLTREHGREDYGAAVARVGMKAFRFADAVTTDVTAEFEQERETLMRGSFARREATVHALLAGTEIALGDAEHALGYRLARVHQAVVVWTTDASDLRSAEPSTAIRNALRNLGTGRALVLAEETALTAWIPRAPDTEPSWDGLLERIGNAAVRAGLGEPGVGIGGFVRTKQQADLARDVARLDPARRLTRYADVALAAVLSRDVDVARAFAVDELGDLAAPTRSATVLRETIAAYFAAGHDQSRTARDLRLHRNTIARRLRSAEAILGRPLGTRVRELEAALVIVETSGPRPSG